MISSNITLGSSPGIDIRMLDPGIANFHARVLYKERKHFLENLDSMGRCYVNGVQATKVVELKDGDVIRLGEIKMQVEYASAQTTPMN
jgi:pSer/pThr/pTyr-binding forkhead associated (FHA) protein